MDATATLRRIPWAYWYVIGGILGLMTITIYYATTRRPPAETFELQVQFYMNKAHEMRALHFITVPTSGIWPSQEVIDEAVKRIVNNRRVRSMQEFCNGASCELQILLEE